MSQYHRGHEIIFESSDDNSSGKETVIPQVVRATAAGGPAASEGIDSAHINPSASFEVFQGKIYNIPGNEYTFADSIERRVESPMQRFVRLRAELSELKSDLEHMKSSSADTSVGSVWATLQTEVESMLSEAQNISNHPVLQKLNESSSGVLTELGEIAKAAVSDSASHANRERGTDKSSVGGGSSTSLALLENRVFALEMLLGSASNSFDMEGIGNFSKSGGVANRSVFPLVESLSRLERAVSMMDETSIENLRVKANALRIVLEGAVREKSRNQGIKFIFDSFSMIVTLSG